jgi:hypothetical protein
VRLGLLAASAVLAGCLVVSCAWGPGTGFASLERVAVTTTLPVPAARLDEAGRLKTDNGYRVALGDKVRVYFKDLSLQAPGAPGGATGGTFDPANPPPGYSLCHGGHCHRADGALIDYADIQAELAGGGATAARTVVRLTPFSQVAFVAPNGEGLVDSFNCAPGCTLDQGDLSRAPLALTKFEAYGTVEAGPGMTALGAAPVSWVVELPAESLTYQAELDATVSRTSPATLGLFGRLVLSERLFDGIEWERLAAAQPGATLRLAQDAKTKETLLANLARAQWTAELKRYP